MNIIIKNIGAFEINADVLVLKYAQGLYGLDKVVVNRLNEVHNDLENKLPLPEDEFISDSKPIENFKKILFIGVPPLEKFRYNEIKKFVFRALSRIQNMSPLPKSVIFTLHGEGYGLDVDKAFESELEGIKKYIEESRAIIELEEIVFVERDEVTARQMTSILEKFLKINKSIFSSDLKGFNKESFELISNAIKERKEKLPSSKNFGVKVVLSALNQSNVESDVVMDTKNILDRLIQFENRLKEFEIEEKNNLDFLFEELNPAYLDSQFYIQKISIANYHEIAWTIQIYILNYFSLLCSRKDLNHSYFLKKKEELMKEIRFNFLNYFGQILIPSNEFPWLMVNDVLNSQDLKKYWKMFESLTSEPNNS